VRHFERRRFAFSRSAIALFALTLALLLAVVLAVLANAAYHDVYKRGLHGQNELLAGVGVLQHLGTDSEAGQLDSAERHMIQASRDFVAVNHALRANPLLRAGSVLPAAERQIRAAKSLTEIGLSLAAAGRDGIAAARTFLQVRDSAGAGTSVGERAVKSGEEADPAIVKAATNVRAARQEWKSVDRRQLWTPLRDAYTTLDSKLAKSEKLLQEYPFWRSAILSFLGSSESKTFLVLNLDSAELRPSGGFIGSIGFLRFNRGKMDPFEFADVYSFEHQVGPGSPGYVNPPSPLTRITGSAGWLLRDSSWSPDFPTSARDAETLLRLETKRGVDGVIAIDPLLIESILQLTGPIVVPEVHQTFDAQNFFLTSLNLSSFTPTADRKGFLRYFGQRLVERLMNSPASVWPSLGQLLQDACLRHDLQASFHDPGVQAVAKRFQCTGEMNGAPGDYVMAVDANLGGGKDNYWLERTFSGQVQLKTDGSALHTLTIDYKNPAASSPLSWDYNNYLRVFVPSGARVMKVTGLSQVSGVPESGRTVIGGWMSIARGKTLTVTVVYEVPRAWSSASGYRFYWQKQAGTRDDPLHVTISLPAQLSATSVQPPASATGSAVEFSLPLHQDREFKLGFVAPRK
jgi:hypothetical protein